MKIFEFLRREIIIKHCSIWTSVLILFVMTKIDPWEKLESTTAKILWLE